MDINNPEEIEIQESRLEMDDRAVVDHAGNVLPAEVIIHTNNLTGRLQAWGAYAYPKAISEKLFGVINQIALMQMSPNQPANSMALNITPQQMRDAMSRDSVEIRSMLKQWMQENRLSIVPAGRLMTKDEVIHHGEDMLNVDIDDVDDSFIPTIKYGKVLFELSASTAMNFSRDIQEAAMMCCWSVVVRPVIGKMMHSFLTAGGFKMYNSDNPGQVPEAISPDDSANVILNTMNEAAVDKMLADGDCTKFHAKHLLDACKREYPNLDLPAKASIRFADFYAARIVNMLYDEYVKLVRPNADDERQKIMEMLNKQKEMEQSESRRSSGVILPM